MCVVRAACCWWLRVSPDGCGHGFLRPCVVHRVGRAACGPHDIGDSQSQFPIAGHHPEWRCSGTALQSDLRLARRSGYYSLECRHAHYRCAGHHLRYSEPAEAPTIQLSYCRQLDKFLPYYWQDFATALAKFCQTYGNVLAKFLSDYQRATFLYFLLHFYRVLSSSPLLLIETP